MNSPNLQPRQFVHNTCELSIDDKKSPFPAWMKFNKPNPLRFALTVNDPDRPDLEPMRVEGDRTKLEVLHRTVENYVKDLLARAPLPQINGEDPAKMPEDSSAFSENFASSLQNRPIDALQVNDDRPRIEADGLSRHLFYLGNGADANTTTMSLSTLQLFDLSSALGEGMTPVLEPEPELEPEKPIVVAKDIQAIAQPVILPPEAVTNNQNSIMTSNKTDKSEVEEPRVVLPSVNAKESKASGDLYGLETESSILERANPPTRDRFNMPKPSLASLNLPELPDFSRSPLTSIPLWLGLGGMAALIMAFPWLSNQFKNGSSVAKQPETPPVQVATTPTDIPTPYQPTDTVVQNGVGTPSTNGLPITVPPSNQTTGIGGQANPLSNIQSKASPNIGSSNIIGSGTSQSNNLSSNNNRSSYSGMDKRISPQTIESSNAALIAQKNREKAILDSTNKKLRKGTDSEFSSRNNVQISQKPDEYDSRLPLIDTSKPTDASKPKKAPRGNPDSNTTPPDLDKPSPLGPLVADGAVNNPVFLPSSQAPNNTFSQDLQVSPRESAQVSGLRSYFQGFWKADPKFGESLQYKVSVDGNGKVLSVGGDDEKSRAYLSKTGFLKPGEIVSKKGSQSQKVLLILHSTGDVETLPDTE